ncbi:MAG: hypothetical protein OXE98_03875 [Hyphomicrobiales bacterium]|nr:hypothetical protein [Hyphomicrobiales bacterium]
MKKSPRVVQYRYFDPESCRYVEEEAGITLLSMIRTALNREKDGRILGKHAQARTVDLKGNNQLTLLNEFEGIHPDGEAFSGRLILYREGIDVQTLKVDKSGNATSFPVVPYRTNGENPIEGVLYFVVIGNHVGFIASHTVRSRKLEDYLNWLLKESGVIRDDDIKLNAKFHFTEKLPPIREILLRTSARGQWKVCEVLTLLGINSRVVDGLRDGVPSGGALMGKFSVFVKGGRQRFDFPGSVLDRDLRNVDIEDGDLDLIGPKGKFSAGVLRLSERVSVDTEGSWLNPNDAVEQIMRQMRAWITQGRIYHPIL